jgi:hypothetical protein
MTTHATIASDSYRVGRYSVQFILRGDGHAFEAQWTPDVPPPGTLSEVLLARYRRLRNQFLAEHARWVGVRALVVDL